MAKAKNSSGEAKAARGFKKKIALLNETPASVTGTFRHGRYGATSVARAVGRLLGVSQTASRALEIVAQFLFAEVERVHAIIW